MGKKYVHTYKRTDKDMQVEKRYLKEGMSNRSGQKQVPEYIVIHETTTGHGRTPLGYDMERYERMLYKRAEENNTTISYHFLCGDKAVWQFLPEDEATAHTGTKEGNHNSIGIERVVCKGVNFAEALHNQAKLTATLMKKWNIPLENVKPHRGIQWLYTPEREDKTPCPSRMLSGWYGGWKRFIFEVERCIKYNWYFEELLNEKQDTKLSKFKQDLIVSEEDTRKILEEQKQVKNNERNDKEDKIKNNEAR